MTRFPVNSIPALLESNEITQQQAVHLLAEFICENYPVFGLQHYTDDFRSEIIIKVLEKGSGIFKTYQKEKGEFFNYFYCYVLTMIRTEIKSISRKNVNEKVFQNHCADNYSELQYSYSRISPDDLEAPKIPYNFRPISPENLRKAFHSLKDSNAKQNIIMALKEAFFLDDEIIENICNCYNLDKIDFIENVQVCKNSLLTKHDRNQAKIQSRNKTYFYEKRYDYQIDTMDDYYQPEGDNHVLEQLTSKKNAQSQKLKNQNVDINDPKNNLRTSNRLIGNILNLCERQVGYYLSKAVKKAETEEVAEED